MRVAIVALCAAGAVLRPVVATVSCPTTHESNDAPWTCWTAANGGLSCGCDAGWQKHEGETATGGEPCYRCEKLCAYEEGKCTGDRSTCECDASSEFHVRRVATTTENGVDLRCPYCAGYCKSSPNDSTDQGCTVNSNCVCPDGASRKTWPSELGDNCYTCDPGSDKSKCLESDCCTGGGRCAAPPGTWDTRRHRLAQGG